MLLSEYADVQSLALFTVVFILCWRLLRGEKHNSFSRLPPGPKGYPVVGNLLSLSLHSERDMSDWNKTYGPVCRMKFATMEFVILGSLEAVNEAFVKKSDVFSDRLQDSIPGFTGGTGIVFLNYGNLLKEQRRFGLSTLKLFGMGKKSLEPKILDLCTDLCDTLETYCNSNEFVDVSFPIYERVAAVISQLVCNKNLPKEDGDFRKWLHRITTGSKYSAISAITVFYPSLKVIPPFCWGQQDSQEHEQEGFRLIKKQIEEHRISRDPKEPRDLIDCFLQEMDVRSEQSQKFSEQLGFRDDQLNGLIRDLFLAGSETSSTTLCWAILFLCKHPEYQSKLHEEVDEKLHQRPPKYSDDLNFAKACIQETLRMRPVAPIGIPHVASKDATIMGYDIKKGSCVAPNLFRILNDENLWPQPEKFDPTRHLDQNGNFVKHPSYIPFSIGPRQCLGMQLANMEIYLFLVSMIQKFSFELESGEDIDMRGQNIFTLRPYPFKVRIRRR